MWLFTTHGMFSVVTDPRDTELLIVRARLRDHLVSLKDRFAVLDQMPIHDTPDRDYAHRIFVPRRTWRAVVGTLVDDHYGNFKSAAHTARPTDHLYSDVLMRVWAVGARAQDLMRDNSPFDDGEPWNA